MKNFLIIVIVICFVILTSFLSIYTYIQIEKKNNLYAINTDENGVEILEKLKPIDTSKFNNMTHIIVNGNAGINVSSSTIYTFDENNIVINERIILKYENQEELNTKYNELSNTSIENSGYSSSNITKLDNKIIYNSNLSNGLTKDRILAIYNSSNMTVDEVIEY